MDVLAPAAGVRARPEPVAPEAHRPAEQGVLGVAGERLLQGPGLVEVADLQRHPVPALQVEVPDDGRAVRVGIVPVERADRREPEAHPGVAGEDGPLRRQLDGVPLAPVVEPGLDVEPDADAPAEDADVADQPVVPGVRADLPDGHVVHDLRGPLAPGVPGDEHVRLGEVHLAGVVAAVHLDLAPPAALAVEDGPEHARAVEVRDAQPVDGAVLADERGRPHVADEAVVLDREVVAGVRGGRRDHGPGGWGDR